jgi:uncharacterized protein
MIEYKLNWEDEELVLSAYRCVFLPQRNVLLLSDLHLGKAAHFRKNGLAVPEDIHKDDLKKLDNVIGRYCPQEVYFLGDLFHSEWNSSWNDFKDFINSHTGIKFHIVIGNHDVLDPSWYRDVNLIIHKHSFQIGKLILSHDYLDSETNTLNIHGHIHPGILIPLKGRQKISKPCFFLGKNQLILPSFGHFTGTHSLDNKYRGRFIAILDEDLLDVTDLVLNSK